MAVRVCVCKSGEEEAPGLSAGNSPGLVISGSGSWSSSTGPLERVWVLPIPPPTSLTQVQPRAYSKSLKNFFKKILSVIFSDPKEDIYIYNCIDSVVWFEDLPRHITYIRKYCVTNFGFIVVFGVAALK